MEKYKNTYNNIEDIERILSPKCDFHVSSDFKERVLKAAESEMKRSRRRWIPWFISAAASVAAVVLLINLLPFIGGNNTSQNTEMLATVASERYDKPQETVNSQKAQPKIVENVAISESMADNKKGSHKYKEFKDEINEEINEALHSKEVITDAEDKCHQQDGVEDLLSYVNDTYEFAPKSSIYENSGHIGPMPIQMTAVSGAMPIALQDNYVFGSVGFNRNDHMDYIEKIRQNLEETALFIQEVLSE